MSIKFRRRRSSNSSTLPAPSGITVRDLLNEATSSLFARPGRTVLTVFGTEQGLRYRIPFGSVDDVIGYLRDHATEGGERVAKEIVSIPFHSAMPEAWVGRVVAAIRGFFAGGGRG